MSEKIILEYWVRDLYIFFTIISIIFIIILSKILVEYIENAPQKKLEKNFWKEVKDFLSKNKFLVNCGAIKWNIRYDDITSNWYADTGIYDLKEVLKKTSDKEFFVNEKFFQIRLKTKKFYDYEWQRPTEVIVTLNK